jgi:hypothetical protein
MRWPCATPWKATTSVAAANPHRLRFIELLLEIKK